MSLASLAVMEGIGVQAVGASGADSVDVLAVVEPEEAVMGKGAWAKVTSASPREGEDAAATPTVCISGFSIVVFSIGGRGCDGVDCAKGWTSEVGVHVARGLVVVICSSSFLSVLLSVIEGGADSRAEDAVRWTTALASPTLTKEDVSDRPGGRKKWRHHIKLNERL